MQSILLELQYFPPVQYFAKFLQFEKVVLDQHENYLKGSYRNRCHIAGANGLLRLSVPLMKGKNQQQSIKEVQISDHEPWQNQHWQGIRSAYRNAPFFDFYEEAIAPLFQQKYRFLFDLNQEILATLLPLLAISTPLEWSKEFIGQSTDTTLVFRNSIFPKKHRQKEDPHFQAAVYNQVFEEKHGFLPNLSILDLLFCKGPEASIILENSIIA